MVARITYDQGDVPFEVVKVKTRAEKYQYSATLTGRLRNVVQIP